MNNYDNGTFYERCYKCDRFIGYEGTVVHGTPMCNRHMREAVPRYEEPAPWLLPLFAVISIGGALLALAVAIGL